MPFDGLEDTFTATLPKHESGGWRNMYSHPTHGTKLGFGLWPTAEAAYSAMIKQRNGPELFWFWHDDLWVLKTEVTVTQIRWEE